METETYNLYGYLDYLGEPTAFVTPVFEHTKSGEIFIQINEGNSIHVSWQNLGDEFKKFIQLIDFRSRKAKVVSSFLYGFKWNQQTFFAGGESMCSYLSSFFKPESLLETKLVSSFISEWQYTESGAVYKPVTKAILKYSELAYKYSELTSKQKELRIIQTEFQKKIDGFHDRLLHILGKWQNVLEGKPKDFTTVHSQDLEVRSGSFLIKTCFSKYHSFDNYFIDSFNESAAKKAFNFLENSTSALFVQGPAATGKTSLVMSIANEFHRRNKHSVIFTAIDIFNKHTDWVKEFEKLEKASSLTDVIVLENMLDLNSKC
jgi:hypothetical protein